MFWEVVISVELTAIRVVLPRQASNLLDVWNTARGEDLRCRVDTRSQTITAYLGYWYTLQSDFKDRDRG